MTMSFSKQVLAAVAAIAVSMALVPLADAAERAGGGRGGGGGGAKATPQASAGGGARAAAGAEPTGRQRR